MDENYRITRKRKFTLMRKILNDFSQGIENIIVVPTKDMKVFYYIECRDGYMQNIYNGLTEMLSDNVECMCGPTEGYPGASQNVITVKF